MPGGRIFLAVVAAMSVLSFTFAPRVIGAPQSRKATSSTPTAPTLFTNELENQIVGLVSPCGLFLAGSKGSANVLTLLPGKQAAFLPPERPKYWVVDDVLIESLVTTDTKMNLQPGRFRDLDLLARHRTWETEWTSRRNAWPKLDTQDIQDRREPQQTIAHSIWAYRTPRPLTVLGQAVSEVYYLTIAIDGVVFVLSTPIRSADGAEKARTLLEKAADGLERHKSPADLIKTVRLIQRVSTHAKDCGTFLKLIAQSPH